MQACFLNQNNLLFCPGVKKPFTENLANANSPEPTAAGLLQKNGVIDGMRKSKVAKLYPSSHTSSC